MNFETVMILDSWPYYWLNPTRNEADETPSYEVSGSATSAQTKHF